MQQQRVPVTVTVRLMRSPTRLEAHLTRLEPADALAFLAQFIHQGAWLQRRWFALLVGVPLLVAFCWAGGETALVSLVVLFFPLCGALVNERTRLSEQVLCQIKETQLIARLSRVQATLPLLELVEALSWPRNDPLRVWWWKELYPILVRTLPLLPPGAGQDVHCRALEKLLSLRGDYEELYIAVLLARGSMGKPTGRTKRLVCRFLHRSKSERVREAARDCLIALGIAL